MATSHPANGDKYIVIGNKGDTRSAHGTLPGHYEPYGLLDGFWVRILGVHERHNGPARLNDLGILVLNPSTLFA